MSPFDVLVPAVPDADLGPLLTHIAAAGFPNPVLAPVGVESAARPAVRAAAAAAQDGGELPTAWREVGEKPGVTYRWPEYPERYERYVMYSADTPREGTVRIALGFATRSNKWGKDRRYVVAFLTSGAPNTPLVEFLEADGYDATKEYVAIVRGVDGGRKMYGPTDSLPEVYVQHFTTAMYRDKVNYPGVWNKVVVVVEEDDPGAMLNHALVQARRRGDL